MQQNRFPLGSVPDPDEGAFSTSPEPLAGFKGEEGKGREWRGGRTGRPRLGKCKGDNWQPCYHQDGQAEVV